MVDTVTLDGKEVGQDMIDVNLTGIHNMPPAPQMLLCYSSRARYNY